VSDLRREPALVIVDAGRRLELDGQGRLQSTDLDPALRTLVESALRSQRVEVAADIKNLVDKKGLLLGGPGAISDPALMQPLGTVVESDRPIFRWTAEPEAVSYELGIYDAEFEPVMQSGRLTGTEWRPSKPLRRGAMYSWEVTAHRSTGPITIPPPPQPQARFRVLSSHAFAELQRTRAHYGDSLLVMGTLYARNGLLDDAERAWNELARDNPDSAAIRELLAHLRAMRRP
jgi:hypothetical protein